MGTAIRIYMEEELKAMERGECAGCRLGCTHIHTYGDGV